ncbi:unnamed protein product [Clonostachys rosea]|uniref:Aminoglycoside phosphotransferase domain-containing protein n=1 Tax=Bionectria ochroleuca TaxID=29856 RepID=A0ABY6USK7_BIOOC|nr:unnamed protein product [Clonostachys rosea]
MVNYLEGLEPGFFEVKWDAAYTAITKSERLRMRDSFTQHSVIRELEEFVASRIGEDRGPATHESTSEGGSHFIFEFAFSDRSLVLLRVPYPGGSSISLKTEKMTNEGEWMQYFSADTSIPIPHVYCFSKDASDLVPILNLLFILMDVIREGQILSEYLASLPDSEPESDTVRSKIYEEFAVFYLQLRHQDVYDIGSIGRNISGRWEATKRLLTPDMYLQSEGIPHYPSLPFPEVPYQLRIDYIQRLANDQRVFLWDLRTLNSSRRLEKPSTSGRPCRDKDPNISPDGITQNGNIDSEGVAKCARFRYRARHSFTALIDELYTDMEEYHYTPVVPFVPHLNPDKMFYDPKTGRITGVFNVEFSNFTMRAFLSDPPPWLIGLPPSHYIRRHDLNTYITKYEEALPRFIEAMKKVEARAKEQMGWRGVAPHPEDSKALSTLMLESWNSRRFWFHYALQHICDVDYLYYEVLYTLHRDGQLYELEPELQAEMEDYVEHCQGMVQSLERDCEELFEGPNPQLKTLVAAIKAGKLD